MINDESIISRNENIKIINLKNFKQLKQYISNIKDVLWFKGTENYNNPLIPNFIKKYGDFQELNFIDIQEDEIIRFLGKSLPQFEKITEKISNLPSYNDRHSCLTLMEYFSDLSSVISWERSYINALYYAFESKFNPYKNNQNCKRGIWILKPQIMNSSLWMHDRENIKLYNLDLFGNSLPSFLDISNMKREYPPYHLNALSIPNASSYKYINKGITFFPIGNTSNLFPIDFNRKARIFLELIIFEEPIVMYNTFLKTNNNLNNILKNEYKKIMYPFIK